MAIKDFPPNRQKWKLWQSEEEMKFNAYKYYGDRLMQGGYYYGVWASGRWGRFCDYSTKVIYYGWLDTSGSWPFTGHRINYYPIPYYPHNRWQGKALGTIVFFDLYPQESEYYYQITFRNEDESMNEFMIAGLAAQLPETSPEREE